MQSESPEAIDMSDETAETLDLYGINGKETAPRGTKMSSHRKLPITARDSIAHAARYDFRCPPSSLSQTIFAFFKSTTGGSSLSRTGGRFPRAEWQRR